MPDVLSEQTVGLGAGICHATETGKNLHARFFHAGQMRSKRAKIPLMVLADSLTPALVDLLVRRIQRRITIEF